MLLEMRAEYDWKLFLFQVPPSKLQRVVQDAEKGNNTIVCCVLSNLSHTQ
jgi:hypothetical protein